MHQRWSRLMSVTLAAVMMLSLVSFAPVAGAIGGLAWERPSSPVGTPWDVAVDADDTYYVIDVGNGTVHKFAADGSHVWSYNVLANFGAYCLKVDLDDTGVYVSVESGSVIKLSKTDGSLIWQSSGIPGPMAVVQDLATYDGDVYVTQPGVIGSFFTLNATTGAYQAPVPIVLPDPGASFYAVDVDATGIYVGTNEYALRRYAFDGTQTWGVMPFGAAGGHVLGGDGYLYVPNDSTGIVSKVDIADGSVVDTLDGQDGCFGVGFDTSGGLYTVIPNSAVVRRYIEPWPEPTPPPVVPETRSIDNDELMLTVNPDGTPEAYIWGLEEGDSPGEEDWIGQYYGDDGWGSVLWLDGVGYSTGYASADETFEMVSNEVVDITGGQQIVTVLSAMGGDIRFTQTFTLMDGDRFFTKDWTIENVGEDDFGDLRFYHGGDTYFGGEDDASAYFDPGKSMIYVRNNLFNNWGIMGFFANPGSPADHYYGGDYGDGNEYARDGEDLPDTADDEFQDAGYYLQWNRTTLPAGRSWAIQAYEIWTPGGPLQVLAPGPQSVVPGTTFELPFTIHNLSEVPQDITLSAAAGSGWTAEVLGDTTPFIGAVERYEVMVEVTVPADATGSSDITLSVTGPEGSGSGTTTLSVADVDLGLPDELRFTAEPGELVWQNVTITNNGDGPITLGTLSMEAPFGSFDDSVHGATIPAGESLTFQAGFWPDAAGSFTGTLVVPVVSPAFVTFSVPLYGNASTAPASLPLPVYRFFNPVSGTHFYTMSAEERDTAIATWPDVWVYEGIAFEVDPARDSTQVHRFYNRFNRSHFYTASEEERAQVELLYRFVYSYEGTGFPVSLTGGPGTIPVYRFYNPTKGAHFYTTSEDEKARVIATMSNVYRYEGIAYYLTVALPD